VSGLKTKNPRKIKKVREQIEILKSSDVILLNEVDSGMPRSNYKNVVEEIAKVGGYNYAYGVEFLEIDASHLGLEDYKWSEEREFVEKGVIQDYRVDTCKYKGLHGNAILSRYPLCNVRIIGLPQPYDWYNSEKEKPSKMEIVRRHFAKRVFNEHIKREVRIGGRMALVADIKVPELDLPITLISTHLENRTIAKDRNEQLKFLIGNIKTLNNPVILGGDFNTGCFSAAPFKKSSSKIAGAILGCVPETINIFRMYSNPTVKNIPILLPNCERCFFDTLQKSGFDCKGKKEFSVNGRGGIFCDSNERCFVGFKPTYALKRSFVLAKYKMDWIFVKSNPCELTPIAGRTLYELNYLQRNPPSDHAPVTVDLCIKNTDK
jgi:endonuclease/exonuclease/phosphatase family metal-dependent hydrolase